MEDPHKLKGLLFLFMNCMDFLTTQFFICLGVICFLYEASVLYSNDGIWGYHVTDYEVYYPLRYDSV
jgi:hypothetical protein